MRHPTAIDPTPALRALIAAMPDERLREFTLEILLGTMVAKAPIERTARATPRARPGTPAKRGRRGWPKGKLRGPRKPKPIAARVRSDVEREQINANRRAARHAAKAAANGSEMVTKSLSALAPTAANLWTHARTLEPRTPWRAVARELQINDQQAVDCYRNRSVPPGITSKDISRFLEMSAS